ncbi:MAG TPA: hypothetical protein VF950_18560 [Planctomycetota bacterium]
MSPLLSPRDLLLPAGREAALTVEVETRWAPFIDPARSGAEVEVENHGQARTGPDGLATVPLKPLPEGLHRLRVRCGRAEAEALVRVAPGTSAVLVTDIDHTIADVSPAGFILKPNPWVRTLAGAVDALTSLGGRMQIVYLSARDHIYANKTRAWLRRNAFPEAPLFVRAGTRFWSCRSKGHKVARLGELRALWPNIRAGIGDLPSDAEAYAAHGIPPIVISPRQPAALPEGAVWVRSWTEILKHLR